MKALTIEILFKAFDHVKACKGHSAAMSFINEALNQRDDTAAISYMLRHLSEVMNA